MEINSFRNIFKATTILGSVQFLNIIIGIIRNKIVSILLGPAGMGILGLFQSTSQTVSGFTNCGVSISAVKNISQAYEDRDLTLLGKVIYVLRRLVAGTGMLATFTMLILCQELSQWSFGNDDFAISFACLSVSLLFTQGTQANLTIIQGCRRINYYAKANVIGNLCSLIISIPLYYLWGRNAIVPVLIFFSISTFVVAFIYERKIRVKEIPTSKEEFMKISCDILKMGIPLAISEIFPIMASYFIRLYISSRGSISDVGFYSAGFSILNGYVGMIFTAMVADYVPRLSAIIDDNNKCKDIINSQIVLSILILFPIIVALIMTGKIVIWILYSEEFLTIAGMMYWGGLGMIYRTLNWCYGCVLIPKRESKAYFILAILSSFFYLFASIIFYGFWGITGLGVGFLASHFFDFVANYVYVRKKYNIILDNSIYIQVTFFSIVIISLIYLNTCSIQNGILYIFEVLSLLMSVLYSISQLNKMMDLKSILKTKFKKEK